MSPGSSETMHTAVMTIRLKAADPTIVDCGGESPYPHLWVRHTGGRGERAERGGPCDAMRSDRELATHRPQGPRGHAFRDDLEEREEDLGCRRAERHQRQVGNRRVPDPEVHRMAIDHLRLLLGGDHVDRGHEHVGPQSDSEEDVCEGGREGASAWRQGGGTRPRPRVRRSQGVPVERPRRLVSGRRRRPRVPPRCRPTQPPSARSARNTRAAH